MPPDPCTLQKMRVARTILMAAAILLAVSTGWTQVDDVVSYEAGPTPGA